VFGWIMFLVKEEDEDDEDEDEDVHMIYEFIYFY